MKEAEWSKSIASRVGERIGSIRKAKTPRVSAQALSDTYAGFGYAIPRSVIANLENGRRDDVSVAELMVLGRALGVPPALLVFSVGESDWEEFLPGHSGSPYDALKWFAGFGPVPTGRGFTTPPSDTDALIEGRYGLYDPRPGALGSDDPGGGDYDPTVPASEAIRTWYHDWEVGATPVLLYAEHGQLVDGRIAAMKRYRSDPDFAEKQLKDYEERIALLRERMRSIGLLPPRLHGDLDILERGANDER